MNLIKKYWWILILVFFLFSFKKKEEKTEEEESNILRIGEHSDRVLRLQKWLNKKWQEENYYVIKVDGKYGIETATRLSDMMWRHDYKKYYDARDKYFVDVFVNDKSWTNWIDLQWLSREYGFN